MNEHGIKMEKTVQALTSFSCSASKTTLQRTLLSPVYEQHTPCLRKKQVTLIFDITSLLRYLLRYFYNFWSTLFRLLLAVRSDTRFHTTWLMVSKLTGLKSC